MSTKRTDLALEAKELWRESTEKTTKLQGVKATKRRQEGYEVTLVEIFNDAGAQALGKPQGTYCTVDLTSYWHRKADFFQRAVRVIAENLAPMLPHQGAVLVVGLGNRAMTPDAVGPLSVEHLLITRHLTDQSPRQFSAFRPVAGVCPGVLGTTGMESGELIRGVVAQTAPAAVVVIDALAARRMERLCATVQIANTGLIPGSGVGNHRAALNQETLGVPVIALGIPTVVDSVTLCLDTLEAAGFDHPHLENVPHMMVTPQDIDAQVRDLSKVLGYAVTYAMQPLELEDITALLT